METKIIEAIVALAFIHVAVSVISVFAAPLKLHKINQYMRISVSSKVVAGVSFLVVLAIGILAIFQMKQIEDENNAENDLENAVNSLVNSVN